MTLQQLREIMGVPVNEMKDYVKSLKITNYPQDSLELSEEQIVAICLCHMREKVRRAVFKTSHRVEREYRNRC